MSETPFTHLLNAWEASAHTPRPAKHGYSEKRQAVLKYVADLECALAAATAEVEQNKRDAGRMDVLESGAIVVSGDKSSWQARRRTDSGLESESWHHAPSLRAAIDAALSERADKGEG